MKTDHITGGTSATHATKRLGRGRGNGRGKTCCRGHKGSGQRSGYSTKPGFEGGQMPLYRRLPQRGFNNSNFRTEYSVVNLGDLSKIKGSVVDKDSLVKAGLVRANAGLIKILGQGDVGSALTIKVDKISQSAASKIEAAGGTLELNAPVTESSSSDQASAAAESPKVEPVSEDAPVNSKEESTPENDSSPEEDTTEEVANSDDDNADDGDAEIQTSDEGKEDDDSTDADSEEKSSEEESNS